MLGKSTGVLLYEEPKQNIVFVSFQGAISDIDDDGAIDYSPRGEIVINVSQIAAFYDHTIVIMGRKIRVMETMDEIRAKLTAR